MCMNLSHKIVLRIKCVEKKLLRTLPGNVNLINISYNDDDYFLCLNIPSPSLFHPKRCSRSGQKQALNLLSGSHCPLSALGFYFWLFPFSFLVWIFQQHNIYFTFLKCSTYCESGFYPYKSCKPTLVKIINDFCVGKTSGHFSILSITSIRLMAISFPKYSPHSGSVTLHSPEFPLTSLIIPSQSSSWSPPPVLSVSMLSFFLDLYALSRLSLKPMDLFPVYKLKTLNLDLQPNLSYGDLTSTQGGITLLKIGTKAKFFTSSPTTFQNFLFWSYPF